MYVQLQKSVLRFHRKNRGVLAWAFAKSVYAVLMPTAATFGLLAYSAAMSIGAASTGKPPPRPATTCCGLSRSADPSARPKATR